VNTPLASWTRKHYERAGGRPFLFYVAFGSPDGPLKISGSPYRCAGLPAGLELAAHGPDSHPDEVDRFREGYLWDELHREQPDLAARARAGGVAE
jgi:hypothetical protein